MKKLYQYFIFLLITKPYLHLAISILLFFILRIAMIQTVYADCWDWNPGKFLLSEPEDPKPIEDPDKGITSYIPKGVTIVASLLISDPINNPEVIAIQTDLQDVPHEPGVINRVFNNMRNRVSFSVAEEANPLTQIHYETLLIDFANMMDTCVSTEEFIDKAHKFVGKTLPGNLWAVTKSDLQNDKSFVLQFVGQLSNKIDNDNMTEETALYYNLYLATIYSYNAAYCANILDSPHLVIISYTNTLNAILGESLSTRVLAGFNQR